jgi:O-antigen/teichoic acid export membrane protein
MGGLFAVAEDFVAVVFGPDWIAMTPVLKVVAWIGMMQSVATTVGTIYLSMGATALSFRVSLICSPLLIGGMAAGLPWGIIGVAVGYGIASYAVCYFTLRQAFGLIALDVKIVLALVAKPLAATLAMVLVVVAVRLTLDDLSDRVRLAIEVGSGIVAYGCFSYFLNKAQMREFVALLLSLRPGRAR